MCVAFGGLELAVQSTFDRHHFAQATIAQAPYFQSLHRAHRKRENRAFHEGIQLKGIQLKASNKSRFCDVTRDDNVGWHCTFTIKLNFKKASAECDLRFTNNDRILSLYRFSFCGATFRRPDPWLDLISSGWEERPGKARPPKRRYRWRCELLLCGSDIDLPAYGSK